MDIYQQVLVKLYEETGGKDGKTANLADCAKKVGLFGSYPVIFKRLSDAGWIAESSKPDFVGITQWGVKEAREAMGGGGEAAEKRRNITKQANQTAGIARDLANMLGNTAKNPDDDFTEVAGKFEELEIAFDRLKKTIGK